MKRAGVAALLLAGLAACGGGSGGGATGPTPTQEPAYPLDGTLRLNQIQVLGTHNSYHVAPPPGPGVTPDRDITQSTLTIQLDHQSVRQVELDVHAGRPGGLAVFHLDGDEGTTCPTFVQCLTEVRAWSQRNRGHLPVFVLVEPKDDPGAPVDAAAVDAEVRRVFTPAELLTPDDVQGDAPTLSQAVLERGWPALGATRDKVVVVLNAPVPTRAAYTSGETSLHGRAMFVYSDPASPLAAFMSVPDARLEGARIVGLVRSGYMVRTRADDSGVEARADDLSRATAALASGAQLVSTDFPAPAPSGYVVAMPGTPARCNPVTVAPGTPCSPKDVESLP
ncbi:MAG: phosphatidylinositol-specific phospholipase C1-like protein [Actinomycetota bacterium]|nr:phosphatidylinositol-specific phospholipase C1-like protein [Actinomycetota bacterium]